METETKIRHRVVGVIIQDGKILLLKRFRDGKEYYVFPGGGAEGKETFEEALQREMKEELSIEIGNSKLLFEFEQSQDYYGALMVEKNHYYLIEDFRGEPELGGPEKERMNETNQYHIQWIDLTKIKEMDNLFPHRAMKRLEEIKII